MTRKATRSVLMVVAATMFAVFVPVGSAAAIEGVPCAQRHPFDHNHSQEAYLRIWSNQGHKHCFKNAGSLNVHIDANAMEPGNNDVTFTYADGSTEYHSRGLDDRRIGKIITHIRIH